MEHTGTEATAPPASPLPYPAPLPYAGAPARRGAGYAGGVTRSVQVAPPSVDRLTVPSSSTA